MRVLVRNLGLKKNVIWLTCVIRCTDGFLRLLCPRKVCEVVPAPGPRADPRPTGPGEQFKPAGALARALARNPGLKKNAIWLSYVVRCAGGFLTAYEPTQRPWPRRFGSP